MGEWMLKYPLLPGLMLSMSNIERFNVAHDRLAVPARTYACWGGCHQCVLCVLVS